MDNKFVKIESVSKVNPDDFIDFHRVDIDLSGRKFGIFVGRMSTGLGINVISGHDFLSVFEYDGNIFKELGDLIRSELNSS